MAYFLCINLIKKDIIWDKSVLSEILSTSLNLTKDASDYTSFRQKYCQRH